ncbi:hypothetical protein ACFQX7_36525 [Luedemannella flava]
MSTRVNSKKAPGDAGLGLPPKSERRALGKAAAVRRAKAKRRSKQLRTAGAVLLALIPVALVVAALTGVFDTKDTSLTSTPDASASAGATAGAGAGPQAPQVSSTRRCPPSPSSPRAPATSRNSRSPHW